MAAMALAGLLTAGAAHAGPFILAGTDADDHGFASGGANDEGWLFMQRALENLGGAVTNGDRVVAVLGSTSTALNAATSAFNLSTLAPTWTLVSVSTASFGSFFAPGGGIDSAGILMMDSGFNVAGGVSGNSFVPYASQINNFLGAGGGLFSQANGYQWLSALVPGLGVVEGGDSGIALTPAGNAAFPGLTNADLSSGPWHNHFTNVGTLPVLGVGVGGSAGLPVILGAVTGNITDPGQPGALPEPASLALVGLGLLGMVSSRRRASR